MPKICSGLLPSKSNSTEYFSNVSVSGIQKAMDGQTDSSMSWMMLQNWSQKIILQPAEELDIVEHINGASNSVDKW